MIFVANTRRIVHRFVLQSRQTVVEHAVDDMIFLVFHLRATQLVACHLNVYLAGLHQLARLSKCLAHLCHNSLQTVGKAVRCQLVYPVELLLRVYVLEKYLVDALHAV